MIDRFAPGAEHFVLPVVRGNQYRQTSGGTDARNNLAAAECIRTTPYYVPDESMQAALCASARRGVDTIIIFPLRNDSWIVAAASRSSYSELLSAGVRIFEYRGGLLHSKTLSLDGDVTLIGSANRDRRSFELNCRVQAERPALQAKAAAQQPGVSEPRSSGSMRVLLPFILRSASGL